MQLYLGLFLLWTQHVRYTPPQPRTPFLQEVTVRCLLQARPRAG